ncbi:addiction module component [Oceanisphaera sp. KMM 10153]|uniref:addiction module component n=1 Tax=Oceanisphaera submarina TaxID=3390193 RepID=UPI0039751089
MKRILLIMLATGAVTGCASERYYDFAMGDDFQELDELQIMDPDAGMRNDGKIAALTLNGEYGVSLYDKYVKGAEAPSEGKTQVTLNFGE